MRGKASDGPSGPAGRVRNHGEVPVLVRPAVLAVGFGAALGFTGRASDHLSPLVRWSASIGALWLLAAFCVGALAGDRRRAAVAGAATIACGVFTYYALMYGVEHRAAATYAVTAGAAWALGGLPIGAAFAVAGDAWRHGRPRAHAVGVALISGALVGEALLLFGSWGSPYGRAVLALELGLGAALPFVLARRGRLLGAVVLTVVVAVVAAGAEAAVHDTMRAAGWRG